MITFILLCFFYYIYRLEERERKKKRLEDQLRDKQRISDLDRELSRIHSDKSQIITVARITIKDERLW